MAHLRGNHVDARSIARKLSCLRGFYRWLLLDKRIAHDPTVTIETPRKLEGAAQVACRERSLRGMLDRSAAAARNPGTIVERSRHAAALALRDHAILELLYAGGLRVGEIVALGEEDLHLDQARAQVRGKGDKERIVPLGRRAVEALDEYVKRGRPALAQSAARMQRALFLSVRGRALTRQWVWEMVRAASGSGWQPAKPARTCCATVAPPTWWSTAPTCAACSACSATPTSPPRRSTPTSPWSTSSASTASTIRAESEGRNREQGEQGTGSSESAG
jgi:integrase/recombinase XerD